MKEMQISLAEEILSDNVQTIEDARALARLVIRISEKLAAKPVVRRGPRPRPAQAAVAA